MKTVALVEIADDGHRTAYMRIFIKTLLQLNCNVLCIMPNSNNIKIWVDNNCGELKDNVSYYDYHFRWAKYKLPHFISHRILVLRNAFQIKTIITQHVKKSKQKIDLLFINYFDKFLVSRIPLFIINYIFPTKWAALLIHSGTYRMFPSLLSNKSKINNTDYPVRSKKFVGLCVHDQGIINPLSNRISNKVLLFPEIADLTPPSAEHSTFLLIKKRAKGRIIIGTIGLEPHKCGYEFLQLAKHADPRSYFFVFAGIFNETIKNTYTPSQVIEFENYFSNAPENALINLGHINEGVDYNSIFCSFDIIYLLYKNFYNASNRLTKSAHFKKLVLGSDHGIISEDIKKHSLGEVVNPSNIKEHLNAIKKIHSQIDSVNLPVDSMFYYAELHHEKMLLPAFGVLLKEL
jgi:hypothetical protein